MTGAGLVVNPGAILSYGQHVGTQAGVLQRIGSALDGARVPADAFGKLPEADDLYQAYARHAADVTDTFARLPGQIDQVAQGLASTARSYQLLERGLTEGISTAFSPAGSGGGAYRGEAPGNAAGTATGTFANIAADSMQAYEWVNESESAIPAFAVDHIYGASSGLEGLLDEGIGWVLNHVPELPDLLDKVTGDTEALKRAARTWHDMGVQLNGVIRELRTSARGLPRAWAGQASRSFGSFMGDVVQALDTIAQQMGQTQDILEQAAAEAGFAHDTIVMIIREVVEWVAGNLAADALTLGLASLAEAPATALFLAERMKRAEQAASRLVKVYEVLQKLITDLKNVKDAYEAEKGLSRLKKFCTMANDFDRVAFDAAKLKNLRALGDGKLAKIANRIWDSGKHGANGAVLEEVAKMGKGEFLGRVSLKAGFEGTMALSGLSAQPGLKGLGKDYVEGVLEDFGENGQGAVDAADLGPSISEAPPESQIEDIIEPPPIPPEER